MIQDLAELVTCNFILYSDKKIYKQILRGYKYVQGDEHPEDYGLYSITFVLLENFLKGGAETFTNQINFSDTFNYNAWMHDNIFKLKLICKLQLK